MDWWAAQFVLGYMLANGADGFKKDLNEARRYVEWRCPLRPGMTKRLNFRGPGSL
jgi:alpha-glucosidase (family GH31 glycosyl hydrolase)